MRGQRLALGEADATDDDAEDRAPKQGLMIPSSMGLRFQVPPDLKAFTVTATWDEGPTGLAAWTIVQAP